MNYFTLSKSKALGLTGLLLSLLITANNAFSAQETLSVGPNVGSKAPMLSTVNVQGDSQSIKQLSGDKGLVILFFRSADWCPFCKKHLVELNEQAEKFKALGYGLAGVSYDNTEILQNFAKQQKISYPLLSDQKAKTVLAYGILNTQYAIGDDNYGIPYPGVVVINKQGKVTHKHFFEGYKKRVKFTELHHQLSQ
jgi:peroxiredoxin